MASLNMAEMPLAARVRATNQILAALQNPLRELLLAHLLEAGPRGLRSNELAAAVGRPVEDFQFHLRTLVQATLVRNEVGRAEGGIYSRYFATAVAEDWFRRLQFGSPGDAIPALAKLAD